MYSQNQEEKFILEYFKDHVGSILDIGANDGKTFSNSLVLIEKGWKATLVEPDDRALNLLYTLHQENEKVEIFPYAISEEDGKQILHMNAPHITGDHGLLSTLMADEKKRWKGLAFEEKEVETMSVETLFNSVRNKPYDFICIDAEGMDLFILQQIDLSLTSLICVEWNEKEEVKKEIISYAEKFGLKKLIYQSSENIILGR